MSASASFMAAQCHLNEAMELLDPPPPSSLTAAGVAKAYDCLLLSAASTTSSSLVAGTGGKEYGGDACHHRQQDSPTATGPDEHMKQYPLDDSWCALQADIYRALLLSAHLLLGMATREESGHDRDAEHNEKEDDNGTSACSPNSATSDGTAVVIDPNDVTTLRQTQRRCRLLLLELADMICTRQYGGQSGANGGHADWHDDILPRSSFQLLRECFESSHTCTNPDGSKERLVLLDIDSMEDEMCHLSANDGVESLGAVGASARNADGEKEGNDDDDADIGFIGFDRKLLEKEENELLDIAMPIDSTVLTTKQSPKKGQKRKRNTNGNTTYLPSGVTKQGCLVLVNSHDEGQGKGEATSSERYFVKLYRSGVLGIQLAGKKKAGGFQFYLGADNCLCQPRPLGDTFHFSLEGAQRLNFNARGANLCSVDGKPDLVFKVDEETGGGLAEGFAWVTAITEVANDASKRREHQEKIRQEWSGGEEWRTAANKRQIKT